MKSFKTFSCKAAFLGMAALCIAFASCSKDDDNNSNNGNGNDGSSSSVVNTKGEVAYTVYFSEDMLNVFDISLYLVDSIGNQLDYVSDLTAAKCNATNVPDTLSCKYGYTFKQQSIASLPSGISCIGTVEVKDGYTIDSSKSYTFTTYPVASFTGDKGGNGIKTSANQSIVTGTRFINYQSNIEATLAHRLEQSFDIAASGEVSKATTYTWTLSMALNKTKSTGLDAEDVTDIESAITGSEYNNSTYTHSYPVAKWYSPVYFTMVNDSLSVGLNEAYNKALEEAGITEQPEYTIVTNYTLSSSAGSFTGEGTIKLPITESAE